MMMPTVVISKSVHSPAGALGPEKTGCVRLDPLPPSIPKSLKKTTPSICSAAQHVKCLIPFHSEIKRFYGALLKKLTQKVHFGHKWRVAPKISRDLSIHGLIVIPLWSDASFLGPLTFSSSNFCIPLPFMEL